jgi:putative endopeptidase
MMPRLTLILVALGCASAGAIGQASLFQASPTVTGSSWINEAALDTSTPACTNFYRHACGGFIASHPASDRQPSRPMTETGSEKPMVEALFDQDPADPELQRLRTFYQSCRRAVAGNDREGQREIRRWLARISAARTRGQVQRMTWELQVIGVKPFLNYSAWPDRTNWKRYRGELDAGVVWADPTIAGRVFTAAGLNEGDAMLAAELASHLKAAAGSRWSAETAENPRTIDQLSTMAPHIDWGEFFERSGRPKDGAVNVVSPAYLKLVDGVLATGSLQAIRAYLAWSFLYSLRGELPDSLAAPFGAAAANVRVEISDTAKRCRDSTVRQLGVEFSRQYAHRILGARPKYVASVIAASIRDEMLRAAEGNSWLTPAGQAATAAKLQRTDLKIAYPDIWPATGSYRLSPTRFIANVFAARRYLQRQEWQRIDAPRDPRAWDMQVYPWVGQGMAAARLAVPNGFPDAYSNSLIMTAAFLSPPRLDPLAPPEVNFGSFGTIFAHEFIHVAETHMFDGEGREHELWSDQDQGDAEAAHACIVAEADRYHPLPDLQVDGQRQLGENVADFGGVRIAFAALEGQLRDATYRAGSNGRSPAQTFFYRYAQNYCASETEGELRKSAISDPHGLPEFRVNAPLANTPGFAWAFGCSPGTPMARSPDKICRVW